MGGKKTSVQAGPAREERDARIVRASLTGIGVNFFLVALKAAAGLAAGSMSMVLDAVNNLTDALSSAITIVGTKLAAKEPDKDHPMGHGRIEYITTMIIAAVVLYAGLNSFAESAKSILDPREPEYSAASLIVIAASIAVKLLLSFYVSREGRRTRSDALAASAVDARFDALLSAAVLASAILFVAVHVNAEAWVSILISVFIIKAGVEIFRESADDVLGRRLDPELSGSIRRTIIQDGDVLGVYDLILHNYGRDRLIGSVHVEVPDTMTAVDIDRMERRIAESVFMEHGVILTGIGIYSSYQGSEDMRDRIVEIVRRHEGVLQMHGFFLHEEDRLAGFDLVMDYGVSNREEIFDAVCREVCAQFPDYEMKIRMDIDD